MIETLLVFGVVGVLVLLGTSAYFLSLAALFIAGAGFITGSAERAEASSASWNSPHCSEVVEERSLRSLAIAWFGVQNASVAKRVAPAPSLGSAFSRLLPRPRCADTRACRFDAISAS